MPGGTLVAESIRVGAVLRLDGLAVTKIYRQDKPDEPPGMPTTWTVIEFQADTTEPTSWRPALSPALRLAEFSPGSAG